MNHHVRLPLLAMLVAFVHADEPLAVQVTVSERDRPLDLGRLLGGNVALWYERDDLEHQQTEENLERWKPGLLRLPGGSWSDEIYWNGHGVREGEAFDRSKLSGHTWQVDFSEYAPGFRLSKSDGTLSDFHGYLDVKGLHEYVRDQGAAAIVTVNAGTGTPEMAAEWVRWAGKEGYRVDYWEIGNELDGEWELGHLSPEGEVIDADEYVHRFLEIAKAMKEVNPSIKVGGPTASNDQLPFVEALIRESGDLLDFVTFHTYPVLGGGRSEAEQFAKADDVAEAVERIRGWIAKYQPDRVGEIEIGVTEWHKQVMETRPTVDLSSGLWTCLFVGAMAESGVDFANQWDLFSTQGGGGHGLFGKSGEGDRAVFHAMMLWRERMGYEMAELADLPVGLRGFATLKEGKPRVLLVNTGHQPILTGGLEFAGKSYGGPLKAWRFSQREYLWNPFKKRPEWSHPAREVAVDGGGFEVPAFSAIVVSGEPSELKSKSPGLPVIKLLLPEESAADMSVEGLVAVSAAEGGGWDGVMEEVTIEVDGVALADRAKVKTGSSVGTFSLSAKKAGSSRVRVTAGDLKAEAALRWSEVEERNELFWEFAGADSVLGFETDYELGVDGQVRPNQTVAVVTLKDAVDKAKRNCLLAIKSMPEALDRARIGGVVGMLGGSPDLASEDPGAFVQVVVQSNLDHWIPIGKIPLSELRGSWKQVSLPLSDPRLLEAMREIYAVRFHLNSRKPVNGRFYVDDLGFTLRGK